MHKVGPSPQILALPPPLRSPLKSFSLPPRQLHKMTTRRQKRDKRGLRVGGDPWSDDSDSEFETSLLSSSGYESMVSEELNLYDSRVAKCVC